MNKVLLIWNIAITIALAMVVISGCSAMDPQFTSLQTEVANNRALMQQVINLANNNRGAINANNTAIAQNALMISTIQSTTQAAIAASEASMKQFIQTYVAVQQ